MMKKLYTFLIALLLSGIVFAQWQELPSFTNATLTQIHFVDENTGWITGYYSATNSGILFRTIDGGQTWDSTSFNHYIASLCFIDQDVGFATGDNSLMKTLDGGVTWTYHSIPNHPSQVLFLDQDRGWIGGYGQGFYQTTDAGGNWEDLSVGLPVLFERMDFLNTNNGYYSGSNEGEDYSFCKTTDGGQSWITIFDKSFHDFKMFESYNGYGIYLSGSLLGGYSSGLYKTMDDGTNWDEIPTPNPQLEYFRALDFYDENSGWISVWDAGWGFGQGEIYNTSNGGESWTKQFDQGVTDFEIVNENIVWALATLYDFSNMESRVYYMSTVGIDETSIQNQIISKLYIFPNPSNHQSTLSFDILKKESISISLFSNNGQPIEHIFSGIKNIGTYQFEVDCSNLPKGIYLVKLQAGKDIVTKKLVVN